MRKLKRELTARVERQKGMCPREAVSRRAIRSPEFGKGHKQVKGARQCRKLSVEATRYSNKEGGEGAQWRVGRSEGGAKWRESAKLIRGECANGGWAKEGTPKTAQDWERDPMIKT